jgi:hypothetical protein
VLGLANGVLNHTLGEQVPYADTALIWTRVGLTKIILGAVELCHSPKASEKNSFYNDTDNKTKHHVKVLPKNCSCLRIRKAMNLD